MVAEIGYNVELYIFLDNTFDSFRIFRFLGDTDFKICAPGIGACRQMGFIDDILRAFCLVYLGMVLYYILYLT